MQRLGVRQGADAQVSELHDVGEREIGRPVVEGARPPSSRRAAVAVRLDTMIVAPLQPRLPRHIVVMPAHHGRPPVVLSHAPALSERLFRNQIDRVLVIGYQTG